MEEKIVCGVLIGETRSEEEAKRTAQEFKDCPYVAFNGTFKEVEFLKGPEDNLWSDRIAVFCDPDGNTLQLIQVDWKKYFSSCARSSE